MQKQQGPKGLEAAVASRLVDLLATSDEFRAKFEQDADAALAGIGYTARAGEPSCGDCLALKPGQKLAPKEQFARDRERLQAVLGLPMTFADSAKLSGG